MASGASFLGIAQTWQTHGTAGMQGHKVMQKRCAKIRLTQKLPETFNELCVGLRVGSLFTRTTKTLVKCTDTDTHSHVLTVYTISGTKGFKAKRKAEEADVKEMPRVHFPFVFNPGDLQTLYGSGLLKIEVLRLQVRLWKAHESSFKSHPAAEFEMQQRHRQAPRGR